MTWRVIILKSAQKYIAAIPNPERERLNIAINSLSYGPYECGFDAKKLQGRPEWRLRIGKYRILFVVNQGQITITVVNIGSRGDIYKNR